MGSIQRQPCEVCGAIKKVHAHHVSYKPKDWFNVKWLCYICHKLTETNNLELKGKQGGEYG